MGHPGSHGKTPPATSPMPKTPNRIEPIRVHLPTRMFVKNPVENATIRRPVTTKFVFMIIALEPVPSSLPYWLSWSYPGLIRLATVQRTSIKTGAVTPQSATKRTTAPERELIIIKTELTIPAKRSPSLDDFVR